MKHIAGTQPLLDTPWQQLLTRMSQDLRNNPHPGLGWAMPENPEHTSATHRRPLAFPQSAAKTLCRIFVARCNDFARDFH
ncbi:hypothetical protein [Delftia sp. ASV31]|uniref:hypothetical protein n=1 Tax=Delftia sp. ASV31 TaxID=2795113 RepID=UPI0018ED1999|nr:hypothetical protein [Delftia sp. ASV31]